MRRSVDQPSGGRVAGKGRVDILQQVGVGGTTTGTGHALQTLSPEQMDMIGRDFSPKEVSE